MKAPVKKKNRLKQVSFWNLAFLSLIFVLGTYVAERTALTTLIGYVPQIIWLAPSSALLVFCLVRRKVPTAFRTFLMLVVFGWLLLGVNIPLRFLVADEGPEFSLMTFNIRHAEGGWEGIKAAIQEQNPDVVCFQEADTSNHSGSAIGELPGYEVLRRGNLAVASRVKILNPQTIVLTKGLAEGLEFTTAHGVTVVNVQLASFSVEKVPLYRLPSHLQSISQIHVNEVSLLVSRYAKKKDTVICGDFNSPPRGQVYNQLNRHFMDSFAAVGWLTGYTYPSAFPLQRIDYAFTSDLLPQSARAVSSRASDHRPVFFKFIINRPT